MVPTPSTILYSNLHNVLIPLILLHDSQQVHVPGLHNLLVPLTIFSDMPSILSCSIFMVSSYMYSSVSMAFKIFSSTLEFIIIFLLILCTTPPYPRPLCSSRLSLCSSSHHGRVFRIVTLSYIVFSPSKK